MNIQEALGIEHSKSNTLAIVSHIGDNSKRLMELLNVFSLGDMLLSQRAAWPLSKVAALHPKLVQPQLAFICGLLNKPLHSAVKRNVMRLLKEIDIPDELLGMVAGKCFDYLTDRNEAIAVKGFSITVLSSICLKEPELKNELIPIHEDMLPFGASALKSRCKKALKGLYKVTTINHQVQLDV